MLSLYEAFRDHLRFLRMIYYFDAPVTHDLTPIHDFHDAIEKNLVYLDEELRQRIITYRGELVEFWNWAQRQRGSSNPENLLEVRRRLDYEIPEYLARLRKDIDELTETPNMNAEKQPIFDNGPTLS